MEKCQQFRHWIWLTVYNELSTDQKKVLEEHIKNCPECQLDYEEAVKTIKLFDQKFQFEPTDVQLETNRAELHQRLLLLTQPNFQKKWMTKLWRIISLDFVPVLRFATATVLLIIGIFLGRIFFNQNNLKFESDQKPVTDLFESNISNIESIQYDPASRQVSIKLSTINDMTIEGDVEKPEIQRVLAQALMTEERPNVRLKTVSALQNTHKLDEKVMYALREIIDKEENPGVRLKAVKLLTSIPITPTIKEMLTRVLVRVFLNDSNSAIRIEAFKGLNKIDNGSIAPVIFNAAKNDSS
ncbi:MAG: zf-HC2 domain-containing protein, partial [bacterium]